MMTLQAPYPAVETATLLPDPELSDSEGLAVAVTRKLAMDGTRYTFVKRKDGRRKLQWTLRLTRNKALELRAFLFAYFASKVQIIDHEGRVWLGYFTQNPFEFETPERAAPAIRPLPLGETQTVMLEFEGLEQ